MAFVTFAPQIAFCVYFSVILRLNGSQNWDQVRAFDGNGEAVADAGAGAACGSQLEMKIIGSL